MKISKLLSVGLGSCAVIATIHLPIQYVQAENVTLAPDICSQAGGEWVSSVGSKLILNVSGNVLSGTFDKTFPPPYAPGKRSLHGSISSKSDKTPYTCPLSFSVEWPKQGSYYSNVTSYTGRYESETDSIRTVFLTVNPYGPGYSSVSVSTNFFSRKSNNK